MKVFTSLAKAAVFREIMFTILKFGLAAVNGRQVAPKGILIAVLRHDYYVIR